MENHFTTLQNHYKAWLQTLGFSSHTVYSYPNTLHYFFEYLINNGVFNISQLKQGHIESYFSFLQTRSNLRNDGKALSTAHLNKSFDAVDKFLEFLQIQGADYVPLPTNYRLLSTHKNTPITVLTKDEIKTLYNSTDELFPHFTFKEAEHRKAIAILVLDLCYGCGLRKSEAYYLSTKDVDLDKKLIFVQQAKGYKDRYVPMSSTITERIKIFIYEHRKYFNITHNRVFPLSMPSLFYYLKLIRQQSGLNKNFGLHTLRHSVATHLLQNGMSIEQIAKFLGHTSLDSTQLYTHVNML